MLTISTLPEATAALSEMTGHQWTERELLDLACYCSIQLQAAAPITATTTVYEFKDAQMAPMWAMPAGHRPLAVLFQPNVAELLIRNATRTSHPIEHKATEDRWEWYDKPVEVTMAEVRIRAATMRALLDRWNAAKNGTEPAHRFPPWLQAHSTSTTPRAEVPQSAATNPASSTTTTESPSSAGGRDDLLTARIRDARSKAADPNDANAVWLALKAMADNKTPPFLGAVEEGLQWVNSRDEVAHLSMKALRARISRLQNKTR